MRRVLKELNLSTGQNYSDIGDVALFINNCLTSGNRHGYRWFFHKCEHYGLKVRKRRCKIVLLILSALDPDGAALRRTRRLRCRTYRTKDPNHLWHLDGCDKVKPFGIAIHGCNDGFSRKVIWLSAYYTNNDPQVVAGYYFNAVSEAGRCSFMLRGDRGTENVPVKQLQTQFVHDNNGRYLE